MIPYEIHKILFKIGDRFAIFTWGVMFAIAWIFAGYFIYMNAKSNKDVDINKAMQFLLATFVGVLFGSRLFHYFGPWGYGSFYERIKLMFSPKGGWVAYGGIIFGLVFSYAYSKMKKINFLRYCDILAPAIPLGLFMGRFGCFLAGCCFGAETNVLWAIERFGTTIHPSQLYAAFAELIVFVIMLELARRHKAERRYDGYLVFSAILLYSIARFMTEFFRGDYGINVYHFGFTFSQLISIILVIFFGTMMLLNQGKSRGAVPKIDKDMKLSYLLVSGGGMLSIISLLFVNMDIEIMIAPFAFGLLILFRGLMAYTSSHN
ncbi:hypothetical protein COV19_07165 [Candidatus Woesearchaeota archaeon CG10_big_fil_rev_8_21_14_0_10_44_13]|nr:MAG: hypothetical protein COV19_07165 [Candidatus Woesearchaeota archaeon CG10_big_fil_rev_8_21_14_0_10_44_13]